MFGLFKNSHREHIATLREMLRINDRMIERLHIEAATARERANGAEKRADIAQNNFEWARVRLNQVEQERATLIATMLKAPVGALELERRLTPEQGSGMPKLPDALFEDIGDDAARALGIDHDNDEVMHG